MRVLKIGIGGKGGCSGLTVESLGKVLKVKVQVVLTSDTITEGAAGDFRMLLAEKMYIWTSHTSQSTYERFIGQVRTVFKGPWKGVFMGTIQGIPLFPK